MGLANFLILSSFSTFFLFPLYVLKHGGNDVDIGVIMGSFALASVVCRPWISEMIDRLGRKKSFTVGCLTMSVMPVTYLFFNGALSDFYLPLLVVRIVHGMGFAICLTAAFTYIADLIPAGRLNEGLGIFGVSGIIGSAVGPSVAELVIDRFGFDALFLAAGLMAGSALLVHLPLSESLVHDSPQSVPSPSFFALFRKRKISLVALLAVLFGFGLAASNGFVSPYASERQLASVSLYYIIYSTSAVVTRLLGARMADRLGEERVLPYAMILTGLGLSCLVIPGGSVILVVAGAMGGCGHGFLYPGLSALALRNEPAASRGKITGAFTGSVDAGAFVGSIMLGFIGQWAGFQALFLAAGGALLAAFMLYRRSRLLL
jgi:MFS family permease